MKGSEGEMKMERGEKEKILRGGGGGANGWHRKDLARGGKGEEILGGKRGKGGDLGGQSRH